MFWRIFYMREYETDAQRMQRQLAAGANLFFAHRYLQGRNPPRGVEADIRRYAFAYLGYSNN
jgi:hypothetical protein